MRGGDVYMAAFFFCCTNGIMEFWFDFTMFTLTREGFFLFTILSYLEVSSSLFNSPSVYLYLYIEPTISSSPHSYQPIDFLRFNIQHASHVRTIS